MDNLRFFLFPQGRPELLWTSLWELFLLNLIDFGYLCSHFYLSQGIFWFSLWFLCWSIGCLVACCLVSTCLCFFQFSSCSWFSSLHCGQKRCLIWLQSSYIYWDFFCDLGYNLSWKYSMCTWKECVFCCFWMECSIYVC